jgi:biopolymer transport protein ExbD
MKHLYKIIFLTLVASGCAHNSLSSSPLRPNCDASESRIFSWTETGTTLTLVPGWRRTVESDDNSERSWRSTDGATFSIRVALYKPAYGNRSIEDETNGFYNDHKKYGEEDLRYLEIDGVRGVHYLRDDKSMDAESRPQDEKRIIWNAQRLYNGERQIINVTILAPATSFSTQRDQLYCLLQSIKFSQGGDVATNGNRTSDTNSGSPESSGIFNAFYVVVSIPGDDEFYFGKRRVPYAQIVTEIDKQLRDRPESEQTVYIKAGLEATFGTVVRLIDDVRAVGYQQIGMVANKQGQPQTETTLKRGKVPPKKEVSESKSAEEQSARNDQLVINVEKRAAGISIRVGGTSVPIEGLAEHTRSFLETQSSRKAIIIASPAIEYRLVAPIISELKRAGANSIRLAIRVQQ